MADTKNSTEEKTKKDIPTSIISVSREESLGIDIANPLNLDQLYATVPEVTRSVDFRAGIIANNGYEIIPADESDAAKSYAAICYQIIERSGGVGFIEQLHKNTDLYGDGYVELVPNQLKQIVELSHVHPYRFGYETEKIDDPDNPGQEISVIKVDKNSQKPVGFATFKEEPGETDLVVDKKIAIEKIAHLKFKTVGDNFNGISLIQPMIGSITRKVKLEDYADRAARLIAVPKLILHGNYDSEEDKRQDAKEAASLDVNDVVIIEGEGADVKFVTPGETNIPALREMFITNITTASGVPRPALTSEGAEINKATMEELMKNLRDIIKSHQRKIGNLFNNIVFPRIAFSHGIVEADSLAPMIYFIDDNATAESKINVKKKKAESLTSLSNTYSILLSAIKGSTTSDVPKEDDETATVVKKRAENGLDNPDNNTEELSMELADDDKKESDSSIQDDILIEMEKILLTELKDFTINNDVHPTRVEDYKKIDAKETSRQVENAKFISVKTTAIELTTPKYYTSFSLETDGIELSDKKASVSDAMSAYKKGQVIIDKKSDRIITMDDFIKYTKSLDDKGAN